MCLWDEYISPNALQNSRIQFDGMRFRFQVLICPKGTLVFSLAHFLFCLRIIRQKTNECIYYFCKVQKSSLILQKIAGITYLKNEKKIEITCKRNSNSIQKRETIFPTINL